MSEPTRVLFLCLGNICRSPLAEGVFRRFIADAGRADQFEVDSAGTGGWHVGEPPDPRSVAVARANGVDISRQRGRQLAADDFERFDWIVAMDRSNLRTAEDRRPRGGRARLVPFVSFVPDTAEVDVPDPYYGGPNGFQHVYDLLEAGMQGLLEAIDAQGGALT